MSHTPAITVRLAGQRNYSDRLLDGSKTTEREWAKRTPGTSGTIVAGVAMATIF